MKSINFKDRLNFLETATSVLCFLCCVLLICMYYSSVYILRKKQQTSKISLFGRFSSERKDVGSVRIDKTEKGLQFEFDFKELASDQFYEVVVLQNGDFLEKQPSLARLNSYEAEKRNCYYQEDSSDFYTGDIGFVQTDQKGNVKQKILKSYVKIDDVIGRPIVLLKKSGLIYFIRIYIKYCNSYL